MLVSRNFNGQWSLAREVVIGGNFFDGKINRSSIRIITVLLSTWHDFRDDYGMRSQNGTRFFVTAIPLTEEFEVTLFIGLRGGDWRL